MMILACPMIMRGASDGPDDHFKMMMVMVMMMMILASAMIICGAPDGPDVH